MKMRSSRAIGWVSDELELVSFLSQLPIIASASSTCCESPCVLKWSTQTFSMAWMHSPLIAIFFSASSKHSATVIASLALIASFKTYFRFFTLGHEEQACWTRTLVSNNMEKNMKVINVRQHVCSMIQPYLRALINIKLCIDTRRGEEKTQKKEKIPPHHFCLLWNIQFRMLSVVPLLDIFTPTSFYFKVKVRVSLLPLQCQLLANVIRPCSRLTRTFLINSQFITSSIKSVQLSNRNIRIRTLLIQGLVPYDKNLFMDVTNPSYAAGSRPHQNFQLKQL